MVGPRTSSLLGIRSCRFFPASFFSALHPARRIVAPQARPGPILKSRPKVPEFVGRAGLPPGRESVLQVEPNLGFITVVQENGGYLGGFLATNSWGRPLEFRLTSIVQPNRLQQLLYGSTLKPYIYADLIGKALIERSGVPLGLLCTDCEPLLDLRLSTETPVAWLAGVDEPLAQALEQGGAGVCRASAAMVLCHPRFIADVPAIRDVLDRLDNRSGDQPGDRLGDGLRDGLSDGLDDRLREPFSRIREALVEARKLGPAARAA